MKCSKHSGLLEGGRLHEYSIACEIWQSVLKAVRAHKSDRPAAKQLVRSVKVEIGELNLIETEQLSFWLKQLAARDGSPCLTLKIQPVPGKIRCHNCGQEGMLYKKEEEIELVAWMLPSCPECGSREVEFIEGKELRVVSAEVDQEENDGPSE